VSRRIVWLASSRTGQIIGQFLLPEQCERHDHFTGGCGVFYEGLRPTPGRWGEQRVTVKHVHVHAGGQAVVGTIEAPGGGGAGKSEDQPHAKQIAHASQPAVWSADAQREPVPLASDVKRPLPDARRTVVGRAEGQ
jgi:hypothetical protein